MASTSAIGKRWLFRGDYPLGLFLTGLGIAEEVDCREACPLAIFVNDQCVGHHAATGNVVVLPDVAGKEGIVAHGSGSDLAAEAHFRFYSFQNRGWFLAGFLLWLKYIRKDYDSRLQLE